MSSEDDFIVASDGQIYYWNGDSTNCTIAACPVELSVYGYRPSLAASGVLIGLYGICIALQVALGLRYKTWAFMLAMVLGCIDEIIGYVGRIMLWRNPWDDDGFIIQIVLITLGPVFFSAAIYVMLYQIVKYISPSHSRFNPRLFYWAFIGCDIISLILQAVGGAMSSTSNGDNENGVNIALAGLSFQVFTLVVFIVLVVDYLYLSRSVWIHYNFNLRFKTFASFLALGTVLILIRCAYRIFELQEGYTQDSEALRDEPKFIALESVMVVLAAYCLVAAHPGPVFKVGGGPAADFRDGDSGAFKDVSQSAEAGERD